MQNIPYFKHTHNKSSYNEKNLYSRFFNMVHKIPHTKKSKNYMAVRASSTLKCMASRERWDVRGLKSDFALNLF